MCSSQRALGASAEMVLTPWNNRIGCGIVRRICEKGLADAAPDLAGAVGAAVGWDGSDGGR